MKSKILVGMLLVTSITANCQELQRFYEWDHPNKTFDGIPGREESTIKWQRVDNVVEACEKESHRRGFNGFGGVKMTACSFYIQDQCTIITSNTPTMHTLGHEVRHCFQGKWHK